jgi:hypothetical protein
MATSNQKVQTHILEVVDNQLRDRQPPETKQAYQRLRAQGYSDQQARELIGCVVSSEIFEVLKQRKHYDQQCFVAALRRLPKMPWE